MSTDVFEVLGDDECRRLLGEGSFGRIAFHAGGMIEIFPVNYAFADGRIVLRTAPGTKLAGMLISADVAVEIDEIGPERAWSVVAHGPARRIEDDEELAWAEGLPLTPLSPSAKPEFVAIEVTRLSGRRFAPGPEPEAAAETIA